MTKVRIKDIAEIANVSVGTVDRVIHQRGEVAPRTRARIQKLLRDFDYKPDMAARTLAMKRAVDLAVIMPEVVKDHRFWELPRKGIKNALDDFEHERVNLHHFYFDQADPAGFRDLVKRFPFESMEGVLFAPVFEEESGIFLRRCEEEQLPVILFNSLLESPVVSSFVGQDAYQSGLVAAQLLDYGLTSGYDLAIVNLSARKDHYTHIIDREKGFRDYFSHHAGRLKNLKSIDLNGADDLMLREKLGQLCSACHIKGIFVTNSRVHMVARFLTETGLEGIRLVGYDLLTENVDYLRRGQIDFLISQKPEKQAYMGLRSLYSLVVFKREPQLRQWLPIDIISRENLPYYQTKSFQ